MNWLIIQEEMDCYKVYSGCYEKHQGRSNGKLNEVDKVGGKNKIIQWGLENLPAEVTFLEEESVNHQEIISVDNDEYVLSVSCDDTIIIQK